MHSLRRNLERTRPSAVSPASATPAWSATRKTLRWWDESSEAALLAAARTA
uniref:PSA1 n=1 Tax=Arundo donax TaxID=35708 RepID=A0A0A9GMM6_ARUDO